MADWAAMESAARHGLACATRGSYDELRLNAMRLLAVAQVYQGDIEAGRALAQQGLAEARNLSLRAVEAWLLNVLSIAGDLQGDPLGPLELDRQSALIHRELGDRVSETIGLTNLGEGWRKLGDLAQSRRDFDASLQMAQAHGDRQSECVIFTGLSTAWARHRRWRWQTRSSCNNRLCSPRSWHCHAWGWTWRSWKWLLVTFQVMKLSGHKWPVVTEDIQQGCLQRLWTGPSWLVQRRQAGLRAEVGNGRVPDL